MKDFKFYPRGNKEEKVEVKQEKQIEKKEKKNNNKKKDFISENKENEVENNY